MSTKQENPYGVNYFDFFKNFKAPGLGLNLDAMMTSHQKNVEAINAAQQTAADVFRGLINLNTQYWRSMFEEASTTGRTMMNQGTPEEKMHHQANAIKSCADKAWNHSREVSDMLNQSTSKVAALYSKRFNECMSEGKEFVKHDESSETLKV